jgi:hypothetical protein
MKKLYNLASISRMLMCGGVFVLVLSAVLCQTGCQSTTVDDPTTRAQADPMGYSPDFNNKNSSSGLMDFDSQGFNKDMHDFLNP